MAPPSQLCHIFPVAMVDSKNSESLRDFIPAAFVDDCSHPYGINLKYQELAGDEIEFTYTLTWRGRTVPSRLTEIPGLLAGQLPAKQQAKSRRKAKKSKTKSSRKSKDKKQKMMKKTICIDSGSNTPDSGASTPKTAICPRLSPPTGPKAAPGYCNIAVSTPKIVCTEIVGNLGSQAASPAISVDQDSLHQLKLDLYKNFNCPRYYYTAEKTKPKKKKEPIIAIPKSVDDISSNRSYFGSCAATPRKRTLLRGGWLKKPKKRTPTCISGRKWTDRSASSKSSNSTPISGMSTVSTSSDRCDITQSSGARSQHYYPIPYLEDQVLLNLTLKRPASETIYLEQFLPTSMTLHDAVDEILKKKANRRLMLKSSMVPAVIFLGCGIYLTRTRPVSHHEYFCSTLEDMMGVGQEVNITVDLRKRKKRQI